MSEDHPLGLTDRRRLILELLVATGASTRDIAAALGASEPAVKSELRGLFKLAGVANRTGLAMWWLVRRR